MTESLQRNPWKVLSTLIRLSGVIKDEILVSGSQEKNWTSHMFRKLSYAIWGTGWAGDCPRGLHSPGSPGRAAAGPAQAPDHVPEGALGTVDEPQGSWRSPPAQVTAQTPLETANKARPFEA